MPKKYVVAAAAREIPPGRNRRIVLDGHPAVPASVDSSAGPLKTWPARLQCDEIQVEVATA